MTTFKDIDAESPVLEKTLKKAGLSLAIIFSKEELAKYNLQYGTIIKLDDAEIIPIPKNI